uniref:ATP-dependent Clp protease proteolytic subunit n=1 Tax=Glaucocystis incrassata TaxID=1789788 RepID=A0A3G1IVA1_9EUKA|nr:ATP-dependent Clp protease proteolytic subunit [Glaucocystis incrassata]YP_009545925.1 ATP-dependent Clp protease proteolytic subunit [Glaucocystis incrassata]ASQ39958.1 ATP-dependent Clp protease proteolytic subunit [Glaucocystis incrassata]ASQ39986.1 ATP-dependent Clp protease proteolytic subunit [Glaucocystis incrassata]
MGKEFFKGNLAYEQSSKQIDKEVAYSYLLNERIIFLMDEIEDDLADSIVTQLLILDLNDLNQDEQCKDIQVFINSPGGSVCAGLAIYDVIQNIRANVSTFCLGWSAGIAAVLLAAGSKGKRACFPYAKIWLHQPMGGFGMTGLYQFSDMDLHLKEFLHYKTLFKEILSFHTGQEMKKVEADMDMDNYMSANESLDYGLIDFIISKNQL